MTIKPFDLNVVQELPPELNDILIDEGIIEPAKQENSKVVSARSIFTKSGATIEAAADQVANLMQNADTAAGRLKAVEMTLKVHGILQELEDKPVPQITVNVIGSENKTLINLVLPTT